jgi:hypothetical protein
MKNLSQALAKLEPVRQVGVMAKKNPHPSKSRHHHGPPRSVMETPPEQRATQRLPPAAMSSQLAAGQ